MSRVSLRPRESCRTCAPRRSRGSCRSNPSRRARDTCRTEESAVSDGTNLSGLTPLTICTRWPCLSGRSCRTRVSGNALDSNRSRGSRRTRGTCHPPKPCRTDGPCCAGEVCISRNSGRTCRTGWTCDSRCASIGRRPVKAGRTCRPRRACESGWAGHPSCSLRSRRARLPSGSRATRRSRGSCCRRCTGNPRRTWYACRTCDSCRARGARGPGCARRPKAGSGCAVLQPNAWNVGRQHLLFTSLQSFIDR
jgi:hypothetical protein